jgi:hypothetical protein
MRRFTQTLLLLLAFHQCVFAQENEITLDGESFTKKFVGAPPNGDKLIEFVRENETFENWTKLIGYRYQHLPLIDNDPTKAAVGMAQILKNINPAAQSNIIVSKEKNEAIIDFLTWPADQSYMEFNIFRYAKSEDSKGVVSLQLAYRFKPDNSPETIQKFRKTRSDLINWVAGVNIKNVHSALAQ